MNSMLKTDFVVVTHISTSPHITYRTHHCLSRKVDPQADHVFAKSAESYTEFKDIGHVRSSLNNITYP
jgi:hypothetical protein